MALLKAHVAWAVITSCSLARASPSVAEAAADETTVLALSHIDGKFAEHLLQTTEKQTASSVQGSKLENTSVTRQVGPLHFERHALPRNIPGGTSAIDGPERNALSPWRTSALAAIRRGVCKTFSPHGSRIAWAIVASWPLDCLLLFLLFGRSKCWHGGAREEADRWLPGEPQDVDSDCRIGDKGLCISETTAMAAAETAELTSPAMCSPDGAEGASEAVRDLGEAMQRCDVVPNGRTPDSDVWTSHRDDDDAHFQEARGLDETMQLCDEAPDDHDDDVAYGREATAAHEEACGEAPFAELGQDEASAETSEAAVATPTPSKRRSSGELKAWMERQREQCQIVENEQALIVTDAKAFADQSELTPSPGGADVGNLGEASSVDAATPSHGQNQRTKRRSSCELKAWMEKKRDQCHVLENTQEHVNTDAKAVSSPSGHAITKTVATEWDSKPSSPRSRRCSTSSQELQDWMYRRRSQCEILESSQVFVATDAKADASQVNVSRSPDEENEDCQLTCADG